jgi:hypothetical protein
MALPWSNVDLERNLIHVEHGWDRVDGSIDPKSRAGFRDVPIIPQLRERLVEWKLACPWSDGLVLGRTPTAPFDPSTIHARATKAWNSLALARITLHEARHTYASMLIAAGEEPRTVMEVLGHSSITITYDLYGHLFPGTHARAGQQLQEYLDLEAARASAVDASDRGTASSSDFHHANLTTAAATLPRPGDRESTRSRGSSRVSTPTSPRNRERSGRFCDTRPSG